MKLFFLTIFLFGCQNTKSYLFNSEGEDIGSYSCFSNDEPWTSQVRLYVDDTSSMGLHMTSEGKIISLGVSEFNENSNIAIYPVENCENAPNFSEFEASTI